jgi:nondiscriminating glutamyl-tRNA synthetase
MTPPPVRVRFAPSPTGELHLGNARTALLNWLFARRYDGSFILRIEDTDQARSSRLCEEHLLADLRWLGVDWDEGPDVGGAHGPYRQSERSGLYGAALAGLIAAGLVYPCYCSEAELEAERAELIARRMMPRYGGKCRQLTPDERRRHEGKGRLPLWRFRVPDGPIAFDDLIRGPISFSGEAIGDFVIVRSNGIPAYNFAVVVDDHQMAISHVLRGEDHLSNTASQLLLYRALGYRPPRFGHHALILGGDHAKLSKRHGAFAVREFRRQGVLPEVLLNALALLGGSLAGGSEVASAAEMAAAFSLERVGKSGAVFDAEKLRWLNGLYIRREGIETLTERLLPFIARAGYGAGAWGRERLEAIVAALQESLITLADIGDLLPLFADGPCPIEAEAAALLRREASRAVLLALRDLLATVSPAGGERPGGLPGALDREAYGALIRRLGEKTGFRGKQLYLPLRAAVTGRLQGPELDRLFALLAPDTLRARIETALAI